MVIESGRARGVSTEILARYFEGTDVDFLSFEVRQASSEEQRARERTLGLRGANLLYGDSQDVVPHIQEVRTGVLVDGPKNHDAIRMIAGLLEQENFPVVAKHGEYKGRLQRGITEALFNYGRYSDNTAWVEEFNHLDNEITFIDGGLRFPRAWDGELLRGHVLGSGAPPARRTRVSLKGSGLPCSSQLSRLRRTHNCT